MPRDPKRIEPLLLLVGALWRRNPDLRFGQIVGCLDAHRETAADSFNAEDADWFAAIQHMLADSKPKFPTVEELEDLRERGYPVTTEHLERAKRLHTKERG